MEDAFGWSRGVQKGRSIPVIVRLHGPYFLNGAMQGGLDDPASRKRLRDEGLAIASATAITAPSHDVLERTRSYYGLALEDAAVIPPPVPRIPASERWDPSGCDPNVILFIGRFDRHKGGDLIIDAFARVAERLPQARLRFVGPDVGLGGDDGRKWTITDYLNERLPDNSVRRRVEWLGRQPPAALSDLRRGAAVTVVCSRYETFGLTAAEPLVQGCPLVVTAAGALPEIVQDGINGLLCRPDDPEDLTDKICRLLNDPSLAARLGQRAMIDGGDWYDPGHLAEKFLKFYYRVVS